jgi:hypothetical protein
VADGRIRSRERSNDLIGNRARDLPTCSIVPQPTTLPPGPYILGSLVNWLCVTFQIVSRIRAYCCHSYEQRVDRLYFRIADEFDRLKVILIKLL